MRLDVELFSCDTRALAIVGPSGAGKTTLLERIVHGGPVVLDGRDFSRVPSHERGFGYVPQDGLLFPHLTVRDNLAFSPRARDVERVAASLGIAHLLERRPRTLSGGEARRVALGRALASQPKLLLLDEPFSGLDEPRRREAMALLAEIRDVPMILVSHRPDEVVGLTDFAVRLEAGRVVATGPSTAVLRAGETEVDNYFRGTVIAPGRVRVGDLELSAMVSGTGDVRLACYAHDILLATEMPRGLSARNVFWTTLSSLEPAGDAVLVTLSAPPLRVLVTSDAARAMDLAIGAKVVAILKATSIASMGAA